MNYGIAWRCIALPGSVLVVMVGVVVGEQDG